MDCNAESAAIVFSNKFLIPHHQQQVGRRATRVSIDDFPVELLVLIFKFVFLHSRVSKDLVSSDCFPGSYPTAWTNDQDLLSASLFPFAVALVCTRWRDVLITIPIFWSRIPIIIDANPTPLHVIQSYLEWSRDVPLDVSAFRKPGTFDEEDPDEKARVTAVVDLLAPHVHRCRILQFDVISSSSLPSPGREIRGLAAKLERLELRCRMDGGDNGTSDQLADNKFSCPILQTLAIDARNFRFSCMGNIRGFWHANSIEISHFSPSESVEAFDNLPLNAVLETLMEFTALRSLTLRDIEFDLYGGDFGVFPLSVSSLTFEGIDDEAISYILDQIHAEPDSMTLIRCPLASIADIHSTQLTLDEISPNEDLFTFLDGWDGRSLHIRNCSSFDDNVLASVVGNDFGSDMFGAPDMTELTISNCPNFSAAKLKETIVARCEHALDSDDDEDNEDTAAPVEQLRVTGYGPPISRKAAKWFQANMGVFQWCTTLPDGRTCKNGVIVEVPQEE